MFIKCNEANQICNKAQYGEASFFEKIKLQLHLLICKVCTLYSKQNSAITEVCKSKSKDIKAKEIKMSDDFKDLLKKKLEKEL